MPEKQVASKPRFLSCFYGRLHRLGNAGGGQVIPGIAREAHDQGRPPRSSGRASLIVPGYLCRPVADSAAQPFMC